jgi:hypothetical protein
MFWQLLHSFAVAEGSHVLRVALQARMGYRNPTVVKFSTSPPNPTTTLFAKWFYRQSSIREGNSRFSTS